jgi:hypothetical protein
MTCRRRTHGFSERTGGREMVTVMLIPVHATALSTSAQPRRSVRVIVQLGGQLKVWRTEVHGKTRT